MQQRVLVTGGAGLVGSHLVDRLLAGGDEVVAVDDFSRGSFANVAHLRREERFAFAEHDVAAPFRAKVDRIFHLAVPSTRLACEQDPVRATMTCVSGTMNVLDVAAKTGAKLVLMVSTERWGEGARCAEALAIDFAKRHELDVRLVRMPAVYGPRMAPNPEDLVSDLLLQALRGEPLAPRVRADRRVRLLYVDDAVESLMRTMNSPQHTPAVVAPSEETTVMELAQLVAETAGLTTVPADSESSAGPPSMPMSARPTLADALPASIALGQNPAWGLGAGLEATFQWLESRLGRRSKERPSGVYPRRPMPVHAQARVQVQGQRKTA